MNERFNKFDQRNVATKAVSLRKRLLLAFLFVLVNFIGSSGLTIYVDQRFIWLVILLPMGAGIYTLTLRCPNCGEFMIKKKIKIWGMEFTYWGGFTIPKNCSRCGKRFL